MEKSSPTVVKSLTQLLTKLTLRKPFTRNCKGITNQLLPFFQFQRLIGRCALSFDEDGFQRIRYECKLTLPSCISAFIALFISTCCIMGAARSQLGNSIPGDMLPPQEARLQLNGPSKSSLPLIILSAFEIVYTSIMVLEYIVVLGTTSTMAKWLNEWNAIEDDFQSCPGMVYNLSLLKFWKHIGIPYVLSATIAFGTLILVSEADFNYPLGIGIIFVHAFIGTCALQTEDIKVVAMFHLIEKGFEQVRKSIRMRYEECVICDKSFDIVTKEEILTWHKILIKIRRQAKLAGQYMAIQQLLSTSGSLFYCSCGFFVTVNLFGDPKSGFLVPLTVFLTSISFIKFYFKVVMAARITDEEHRLASLLNDLEFVESNSECRSEIKAIYEILINSPTQITLNNYVTLNNNLISGFCGQVLTQFIVLEQFKGTS